MDLSKAFDTLNHDLLIAKLSAYGFEHNALKLIYSYLTNRWHRTKINSALSSWEEVTQGFPKVLFFVLLYLMSISMIYFISLNELKRATLLMIQLFTFVINILALLATEWFESNRMKLNQEKCHLLLSGNKHESIWNQESVII